MGGETVISGTRSGVTVISEIRVGSSIVVILEIRFECSMTVPSGGTSGCPTRDSEANTINPVT